MRQRDGTEMQSKRTVPWHRARAALCILFAVAAVLSLSNSMPAQAKASPYQIVSAGFAADPCQGDPALGIEHCHLTTTCPLCAPLDRSMGILAAPDLASRWPSAAGKALNPGRAIEPQIRPPALPLRA